MVQRRIILGIVGDHEIFGVDGKFGLRKGSNVLLEPEYARIISPKCFGGKYFLVAKESVEIESEIDLHQYRLYGVEQKTEVEEDGKTSRNLSQEEQFNLFAFGDYSQKFSFDVGCGLPGRVYESGRPTWEQSVQNAPHNHFERCGGAHQWGIRTVVGIPISSPNVGRIVVTLYSIHDRHKDEELVVRLSEEFTRVSFWRFNNFGFIRVCAMS